MLNNLLKHILKPQNKMERPTVHLLFRKGRKKLIDKKKWKRLLLKRTISKHLEGKSKFKTIKWNIMNYITSRLYDK